MEDAIELSEVLKINESVTVFHLCGNTCCFFSFSHNTGTISTEAVIKLSEASNVTHPSLHSISVVT
jgi:hypothetical protein